ncbi:MAG TPA: hypothetical protein VKW09_11310 [bacterium]|nr:hypothetical protein [bacterium]
MRNFAGNHEQIRIDLAALAARSGLADQMTGLVRECMNDYDLEGWREPGWS